MPVLFSIGSQAQVTIYSQDFSGSAPWGMTTTDLTGIAPSHVWISGSSTGRTNQTGGTGDYGVADSDYACDGDFWDSDLRTPVLDLSTYSNVSLSFRGRLRLVFNNTTEEEGYVEVSTNGGTSWNQVSYSTTSQGNPGGLTTVNLGAYDLTPNVMVRWRYQESSSGCAWYWQVDDITITGTLAIPCTSPPTAGTTVSSAPSVCAGGSVNLSLSGGTAGTGQTYQWQSSLDNVNWTNVAGQTGPTTTQTINDTIWYRNIVTCSGQSDTSAPVMVTTDFMQCYCKPIHDSFGPTDCTDDYVSEVLFNTINNSSTCGGSAPQNYSDYTAISTTVFKGATYPISVSIDGDDDGIGVWIDYDHSGTFDASEFVLNGYTGNVPETYTGSVSIPLTALTGPTSMRIRSRYGSDVTGTQACATFSYGEVEEYTINILPQPADDAGISAILSPGNGTSCSVSDSISVIVTNMGTNALTSADINVSVNGGAPTVFPWTGNIPSTSSDTVYAGNVTIVDGDVVTIWTSNPNGTTDGAAMNDTLSMTAYEALNGTYTVGGTTPDFNTVNDAVTTLLQRGVCGPVIFDIRPGTYTEQVTITPVTGVSAVNTVTFQSEGQDASTVTIDFTPTGEPDNFVFHFAGSSHIILNELTLESTSDYAIDVFLTANAHHITVQNCTLISDSLQLGSTFDQLPIYSYYESGESDIHILNNDIIGGYRSIEIEGVDMNEPDRNWVIRGNRFSGFYEVAIAAFICNSVEISENVIESSISVSDLIRIYTYQIYGLEITGNDIRGDQSGVGIFMEEVRGAGGDPAFIANNFIYMGDSVSSDDNIAINVGFNTDGVDIVNNSIHTFGTSTSSAGISLNDNSISNISVLNNNVQNSGAGYALYVMETSALVQSGYNNFYSSGINVVGYGNADYMTLAAFTSATGFDVNSVSVDPMFIGDDLHTCRIELDNTAMPYPGITTDFDGDTRTQTPDIGADEFITAANFTLGPDVMKCPNDSVLLGAEVIQNYTYYWSPYFQGTPTIYASAPGLYVAQVATGCGTAVDSIMVTNYPAPVANFSTSTNFYTVVTTNTSTNGVSYSWTFGDGGTSTDFEPSHVYGTEGTYTITLTVVSECGDTVTHSQVVNVFPQFVGVPEEGALDMNIFPNPSDGHFNLTLSAAPGDVLITITDLSGRTVYNRTIGNAGGDLSTGIDLYGVSSGTYLVRITSGNVSGVTRLVIKK